MGTRKREKQERQPRPERPKPIRLSDLIPTRDVTGGRSVFGTQPPASTNKRKVQK